MRLWQLGVTQEIQPHQGRSSTTPSGTIETVEQLRMSDHRVGQPRHDPGHPLPPGPVQEQRSGGAWTSKLFRNFEGVKFFLERNGVEIEPAQYICQNDQIKISQRIGRERARADHRALHQSARGSRGDPGGLHHVPPPEHHRPQGHRDSRGHARYRVLREDTRIASQEVRLGVVRASSGTEMIPKTLILRIPKQEQLNMPAVSG